MIDDATLQNRQLLGLRKDYVELFEAARDPLVTRTELQQLCDAHEKSVRAQLFIRVMNAYQKIIAERVGNDHANTLYQTFDDWTDQLAFELDVEFDRATMLWRPKE
jgi:flagellar biosynthesis/type III secretory pathway protein FliH